MNSGVNGEPWQATRNWRGSRGFAASDGPTCSLYRSRLTRTFAATVDAGLADTGDAVLSPDGSAAKAAAAVLHGAGSGGRSPHPSPAPRTAHSSSPSCRTARLPD